MRRWLLLVATVVTWMTMAGAALADTRQGSVDDPRDTPQDVNGNYNHQDVQQVRVLYDTVGTLRVTVRFYAPIPTLPRMYPRPRFYLTIGSSIDGCTSSDSHDASVSMPVDTNTGDGSITIDGLEGSIPASRTISADGTEVQIEATHQALANRGYKCASDGRLSNYPEDGDSAADFKLIGPGAYREQPFPAPACSSGYIAYTNPALRLVDVPRQLAFGREADFVVQETGGGTFPYQKVEPAYLAITGNLDKKPFVAIEKDIVDQTYFVTPERREGRSYTVALSYVEGPDPSGQLNDGNCRRLIVRTLAAVTGTPPRVKPHFYGDSSVDFTVGTAGQVISPSNRHCSLTQKGSVTLKIHAPDRTRNLKLTDACTGRWGATIRGRGWKLRGLYRPDDVSDGEAEFLPTSRTVRNKKFTVEAFFRGRRIARTTFRTKRPHGPTPPGQTTTTPAPTTPSGP
jgi:hypothetical protein